MYDFYPPPEKLSLRVRQINHLMRQREHLILLRKYLTEISQIRQANNPSIVLTYQSLVDLLELAIDEYDSLVGQLQKEMT
jgi:hypothetical protein